MRATFTAAWLFGMGLISYRYIVKQHQPPIPGSMLAASGLFALLALVAEYQPAAGAAAAAAWGFDLAALLYQPGEYPNYTAPPLVAIMFGYPPASKTAAPAKKTTSKTAATG